MTEASAKSRDRARTAGVILAAAREQLAEAGFQDFGVNTVARRAGCDKQLIYRYFGGLEGLVDAIGLELANWVDDSIPPDPGHPPTDYCGLMQQMILAFLTAFRANKLVQKIAAWELAEPSPLAARLSAARATALAGWMARRRAGFTPPPGVDAPAINALMIAAVQHIVLSAENSGAFAGVPLRTEADWDRIRAIIVGIVASQYAAPPVG